MTVALSDNVKISPDVLSQEVSSEMVLLDLRSEAYFGLDATGARIWQLIHETGNLQSAFDSMLAEFDVDEGQLQKDFSDLLARLSEAGLISLRPSC